MVTAAFKLIAGHPAVDFVNTVGGTEPRLNELLPTYAHLVAWAEQAGLLEQDRATLLAAAARADPGLASDTLDEARRLRDHFDDVLRAEVALQPPAEHNLEAIRHAYLDALAHAHLVRHTRYDWTWPTSSPEPRAVLWPIAKQIVELLSSPDLNLLKVCSNNCRSLYLDRTKNHNRRWCTPDTCGASVRMRRYRATRRQPSAPSTK